MAIAMYKHVCAAVVRKHVTQTHTHMVTPMHACMHKYNVALV